MSQLIKEAPFSFVYGLPAMFNGDITPDRSLRGAELLSGWLDFSGTDISGSVSFHTSNAAEFVDTYNALDSASDDVKLMLKAPVGKNLSQVVVPIVKTPIRKSGKELVSSRNILKKLFVGMAAHDYAEDVHSPGNMAWMDLMLKSEADGDGLPGSVFYRWDFKDQAAIAAFEKNELPAGFTLADAQFLESDGSEKFLLLNVYNVEGAVLSDVRAEWDIFVNPPVGADPNAGIRPRFMVIDALAGSIAADSVRGVTQPEPLLHQFDGNNIKSSLHIKQGDLEMSVFEASFPKPKATAPIARFTREMAVGNDYIYWGHGLYDRVLYNATTFNHDALFAETEKVQFSADFHWKKYLKEDLTYVVYYVNTLEYIVSPWANFDSQYLDITPEWLEELRGFYNLETSYIRMMREAVEGLFRGRDDVISRFNVENSVPAAYYNFRISDPDAMSESIGLPAGYSLAKTRFFENDSEEDYYLTLALYEVEDSLEGMRAEWSVYVDDGRGREHFMVVELQTQDVALDPVSLINLPSKVEHKQAGGIVSTSLASSTIDFEASFSTASAKEEPLSLDWIEAGDYVCSLIGICDKLFYDAETMDVPVHVPSAVTVTTIKSPWNEFIDIEKSEVFYRDNFRQCASKPWHNLKVFVKDPAPPDPAEDGTHVIAGTGQLVGRKNTAVDSIYTYTGSGTLDGNVFFFALDQSVENVLGKAHFFSNGKLDLVSGLGTSIYTACSGETLVCANIDPFIGTPAATVSFTALNMDASDKKHISWDQVSEVTIPSFGTADTTSHFEATAIE